LSSSTVKANLILSFCSSERRTLLQLNFLWTLLKIRSFSGNNLGSNSALQLPPTQNQWRLHILFEVGTPMNYYNVFRMTQVINSIILVSTTRGRVAFQSIYGGKLSYSRFPNM